MGVPLVAAGASFLSKKLLKDALKRKMIRKEIADNPSFYKTAADPNKLRVAKLTGNAGDLSGSGSTGLFAKRLGLMGLATGAGIYGANSLINHPRNEAMERLRGGDYMANPMMGKSHDPSYEASLTRAGKVQTMMEEMDGMGLSEAAKRQIIEDKLGLDFRNKKEYDIMENGMNYPVTGAAKTVQEVGDTYPDVEFQESVAEEDNLKTKLKKYGPFLLDPTGFNRKLHGGTYNAIKTWMGMPRDK
jgi:hypothetical protein